MDTQQSRTSAADYRQLLGKVRRSCPRSRFVCDADDAASSILPPADLIVKELGRRWGVT